MIKSTKIMVALFALVTISAMVLLHQGQTQQLPVFEPMHSTVEAAEEALRPSVAERQKAIQARMEAIKAKTKPPEVNRTAAQGEELARDANYLAAQRMSKERAAKFHNELATGLDLNAEETKRFLAILESAHQSRLKAINYVLKQGSSYHRKDLRKQVERGTLPEEIERANPVRTNENLRKLLGAERFEAYLRLREIAGALKAPGPFQGTLVVTSDTELTDHVYGNVEIAADNVTLNCQNNVIINALEGDTPGIIIQNRSNVTLYDCEVHFYDTGVLITGSTGIHVEHSSTLGNGVGYRVEDSSNVDFVQSGASHNGAGWEVRSTTDTFYWGNVTVQNAGDGFDENYGTNPYYLRNDAYNNGVNAFELDFAPTPTYWENWVFATGQHGISLDAIDSALVHDNEIVGSGEDGLRLDDEAGLGTINSLVRYNYSSGNGGRAAHQCGDICTGNVYTNNWFEGSTNNIP